MKITDVNVETGETIVRDATPEEIAQYEKDIADEQAKKNAAIAAASAKAALLEKLGITEDEAKLLLS